jgi:hypothetical protein
MVINCQQQKIIEELSNILILHRLFVHLTHIKDKKARGVIVISSANGVTIVNILFNDITLSHALSNNQCKVSVANTFKN